MPDFPKRYEIRHANLNPTIGSEIRKARPVVIVSKDDLNRLLDTVVVCPLTSSLHPHWRTRLQIKCAGRDSEIAIDQIRTISKQRLVGQVLDRLSSDEAAQLRRIIGEMYAEP